MIDKEIVQRLAENFLENSSHYLVGVDIHPNNHIVVEIDSDQSVGIDDCVALSRYIESQLDREVEDFELEVGSAGITQPFKILRQYQKNIGNEVETLTRTGKKISGILQSAGEHQFTVRIEKQVKPEGAKRKISVEEELTFSYDEIKSTKYVIRFK